MSGQSKARSFQQLTLFAEDSLARTSAWQEIARAWVESGAGFGGSSGASWLSAAPSGALSKTLMASCRRTMDGIWEPFSEHWGSSGMGSPTECWTLNTSDWPNGATVCSLSDILETGEVPAKYYLSPKAAAGILRRAERRGKALPALLKEALTALAAQGPPEAP